MTVSQYFRTLLGVLAGSGGAAVPAGGMKTLTINDATPIDPLVETTSNNTVGASGSGWVATVVLKGITSLVGTCVPSALTLSVTDPGYDTSGNATTVARTITGVAQVRRQWPNGATMMISTNGTDLTLLISLDDMIYSGTTIVSATIGGTFYTGCTAGNTGSTITNASVTAYTKPLFGWVNPQADYTTLTSYPVEAYAFHRHARAGQQVAAVKFSVTDGTLTTSPAIVSVPTLSTKQTVGNIAEVWAANLDLSTLANSTAGTVCSASAKVYPWIGDASAVLDVTADGVAWPTTLPITPLRIFNDRSGTYGGGFAYVLVGASGGTVSAVAATARAAPFPTLVAAFAALCTWNNTNRSHNTGDGGTIRLMDNAGAAQTHTISGNSTNVVGVTPYTIEADPLNTGVISITYSTLTNWSSPVRIRNLTLLGTAGANNAITGRNEALSQITLDTVLIDATAITGTFTAVAAFVRKYFYNITLTGDKKTLMSGTPIGAGTGIATAVGIVSNTVASCIDGGHDQPKILVGCSMPHFSVIPDPFATNDGEHGRIVYNNRALNMIQNKTTVNTLNYGFANVQNVFETDESDGNVIAMNFCADGDFTTVLNYIEFHNTAVGDRCSRLYNDAPTTQTIPSGIQKAGVSRYNIWDDYNCKTDTFRVSSGGSVGNWAYNYSVGNTGNVCLFGAVGRGAADAPHNDNADQPYLGAAWLPSSEYNVFRTALGFTQAQIMAMFTNYTVKPQAVPALGGTYTPLSTATLIKSRVPTGFSILKRDIAGTLRRTDGTGAAGAYESL